MLNTIDYRNTSDTGEPEAPAVKPVLDGDPANATSFGRPTENLRSRSDVLRQVVREHVVLQDVQAQLLSGGGTITFDGAIDGPYPGKVHLGADLWVLPYATPGGAVAAPYVQSTKASRIIIGANLTDDILTFTSRYCQWQRPGSAAPDWAAEADQIAVEITHTGTLSVTVSGAAGKQTNIYVTINYGVTTCQQVMDAVVASLDANKLVIVTYTGAGDPAVAKSPRFTTTEWGTDLTARFLRGGSPGLAHRITDDVLNGVAGFFLDVNNCLHRGDTLAIWYDALVNLAAVGGRLQSTPENVSTDIPASSLFNTRYEPHKIPNCIPICKCIDNNTVVFIDGSRIIRGTPASLWWDSTHLLNSGSSSIPVDYSAWTRVRYAPGAHVPPANVQYALDNIDDIIEAVLNGDQAFVAKVGNRGLGSTGDGAHEGVYGKGGLTGTGVIGQGGDTSGVGVVGTGGPGSAGVTGQGVGVAAGVEGTGGVTDGPGVRGTGHTGNNGTGVIGNGTGTASGVSGTGGDTDGKGVAGQGVAAGTGVYGKGGLTGAGVTGQGGDTSGVGVAGTGGPNSSGVTGQGVGTGHGVEGTAVGNAAHGVRGSKGTGTNGAGVYGEATSGSGNVGVKGQGVGGGDGVYGESPAGAGVHGKAAGGGGYGIEGESETNSAVYGHGGGSTGAGVYGYGNSASPAPGVRGRGGQGKAGVEGLGGAAAAGVGGDGVHGAGTDGDAYGVHGVGKGNRAGVLGETGASDSGVGVEGTSVAQYGVVGRSGYWSGVYGESTGSGNYNVGVEGYGQGSGGAGVYGHCDNGGGVGVKGKSFSLDANQTVMIPIPLGCAGFDQSLANGWFMPFGNYYWYIFKRTGSYSIHFTYNLPSGCVPANLRVYWQQSATADSSQMYLNYNHRRWTPGSAPTVVNNSGPLTIGATDNNPRWDTLSLATAGGAVDFTSTYGDHVEIEVIAGIDTGVDRSYFVKALVLECRIYAPGCYHAPVHAT